jgi:hypothetical protein
MKAFQGMPDWPALMDQDTAILYLCGRKLIYETLIERKYLTLLSDRHKAKLCRRVDIDNALAMAIQNEDDLKLESE